MRLRDSIERVRKALEEHSPELGKRWDSTSSEENTRRSLRPELVAK